MSIADAFISKYTPQEQKNIKAEQFDVSTAFDGTRYATRLNNTLNPRQNEFYLQQKAHQERLNYLHFKYRLHEDSRKFTDDIDLSSIYLPNDSDNYEESNLTQNETETYSKEESLKLQQLTEEESKLQKEFLRQQKLLEDTRVKITKEVDRMRLLLEKFRKERQTSMKNLKSEYSKRKERYEEDITTIRNTELRKPEININIIKEKTSKSSKIYKNRKHSSTTEVSNTIFNSDSPSLQEDILSSIKSKQ